MAIKALRLDEITKRLSAARWGRDKGLSPGTPQLEGQVAEEISKSLREVVAGEQTVSHDRAVSWKSSEDRVPRGTEQPTLSNATKG